jgi:hypothetical protein
MWNLKWKKKLFFYFSLYHFLLFSFIAFLLLFFSLVDQVSGEGRNPSLVSALTANYFMYKVRMQVYTFFFFQVFLFVFLVVDRNYTVLDEYVIASFFEYECQHYNERDIYVWLKEKGKENLFIYL